MQYASTILILVAFITRVEAGPLIDRYKTEHGSVLAGILTAQTLLTPRGIQTGPLSARFFQSGTDLAQTHVQAAANLLAKIDAFPGSYGHAKAVAPFSSTGDGKRSANPLYKKVVFEFVRADQLGVSSDRALDAIFNSSRPKISVALQRDRKNGFRRELKTVAELGLDTPENLELLRKGLAPLVTKGNPRYVKKKAEVDHRVARSRAPQFENEVANLQLLPEKINGIKLASHTAIEEGHQARLTLAYGRSPVLTRLATGAVGGAVAGAGITALISSVRGEAITGSSVVTSAGVGAGSGLATMLSAKVIDKQFGTQLAKSMVARRLLPTASKSVARGLLSGGMASAGVGAAITLGFVAKDFLAGEISNTDAFMQSGVGIGSVGAGVGAGIILAYATTGTVLGTELPIVGNAAGFVGGAVIGAAVYVGGNWYYENFKAEAARAELKAFRESSAKWQAAKLDREFTRLRSEAQSLRAQAATLLAR